MKFSIRSGAYCYSVNLYKYQKRLSVQLYVSLLSIYWYHLYNYVNNVDLSVKSILLKIFKLLIKNPQAHNTFTLCVSTLINNVVIIVDGFGSDQIQYELS